MSRGQVHLARVAEPEIDEIVLTSEPHQGLRELVRLVRQEIREQEDEGSMFQMLLQALSRNPEVGVGAGRIIRENGLRYAPMILRRLTGGR